MLRRNELIVPPQHIFYSALNVKQSELHSLPLHKYTSLASVLLLLLFGLQYVVCMVHLL